MSNTYHISAYARRRHSRVIHPCHVDICPTMCDARRFRLSICLFISAEVGLLCKQGSLDLGKTNIGDLLAIIYHSTSCGSCTECSKLQLVTYVPPTNIFQFLGPCKFWFICSKVLNKYWVSGITCHMYSRGERTGEINDMSAFIPGAERYFRRSLHVKNCRDRLIISSGYQEKGGCLLIRAGSVITSNTVNRFRCLACVSLITKHFCGLKCICQSYSHFISGFRSFWSSCESFSFFISLYSTQSSANRRIDEWILFGKSLI